MVLSALPLRSRPVVLRHGIPASERPLEASLPSGKSTIMNSLHAPQRPSGLPDTLRLPSRDDRISFLDRLALHAGVRLLLWSAQRTRLVDDRTRHSAAFRQQEEADERSRAYLRGVLLAHRL
jgi:hypothetical protein